MSIASIRYVQRKNSCTSHSQPVRSKLQPSQAFNRCLSKTPSKFDNPLLCKEVIRKQTKVKSLLPQVHKHSLVLKPRLSTDQNPSTKISPTNYIHQKTINSKQENLKIQQKQNKGPKIIQIGCQIQNRYQEDYKQRIIKIVQQRVNKVYLIKKQSNGRIADERELRMDLNRIQRANSKYF